MLAAVLCGKRRGTGLAGKNLALGSLEGAEDILTATVFERLAYLPDVIFSEFINILLPFDEPINGLEEIQFWPSWELEGHRIEPDVVLFCGQRNILVEAKRVDSGLQQCASQLANELKAGCESNIFNENTVLLTVGGMLDYSSENELSLYNEINVKLGRAKIKFDLACRSWKDIFLALQAAIKNVDDGLLLGCERILDDIADVYEWHGLRTHEYQWLAHLSATGVQRVVYPGCHFPFDSKATASPLMQLSRTLFQLKTARIACSEFSIKTWGWNHG